MHEYAVTKALIDSVLEEAKKKNLKDIKEVEVEVGQFTTYSGESITFYYDVLKKESSELKDSILDVKEVRGEIVCRRCGKKSEVEDIYIFLCPHCGSNQVDIVKGKEFIIRSVKV